MFLLVSEVAEVMKVSPSKVRQWIEDGRLEAINVASSGSRHQWRIHEDALKNIGPPRKRKIVVGSDIDI